jgi:hypothetical protein
VDFIWPGYPNLQPQRPLILIVSGFVSRMQPFIAPQVTSPESSFNETIHIAYIREWYLFVLRSSFVTA